MVIADSVVKHFCRPLSPHVGLHIVEKSFQVYQKGKLECTDCDWVVTHRWRLG